jgi:hypothetical protein
VKSLGDAIQFAADRRAGAKVSDIIPVKGRSDLRLRRWQRQHIVDHCARASTWVVAYDKIIYTETKTARVLARSNRYARSDSSSCSAATSESNTASDTPPRLPRSNRV